MTRERSATSGDVIGVRRCGLLEVDDGHQVYWEESGNPHGLPVLYLHGGPGAGLEPGTYRGAFDHDLFNIIGIDQRGCGRSTPRVTALGYDLRQNTTHHLIADLERLRRHLGIERWLVTGSSWGVTLAVAYAQEHPERVLGMTLAAVTTTDRFYVDWITEKVSAIYPEAWDRLAAHAERAGIGYRRGRSRLIDAYARLIVDPDSMVRDAAVEEWIEWEYQHVSIGSRGVKRNPEWDADPEWRRVFATLVTHYWAHDAFLDPPITDPARMRLLSGIPAVLVHGRLDVSGPPILAWTLRHSWPAAELIIEEDAGHGGLSLSAAWWSANTRHADRILGGG